MVGTLVVLFTSTSVQQWHACYKGVPALLCHRWGMVGKSFSGIPQLVPAPHPTPSPPTPPQAPPPQVL